MKNNKLVNLYKYIFEINVYNIYIVYTYVLIKQK